MNHFTAHFLMQPGAKARLRTALKLMGAESVRIVESEQAKTVKARMKIVASAAKICVDAGA